MTLREPSPQRVHFDPSPPPAFPPVLSDGASAAAVVAAPEGPKRRGRGAGKAKRALASAELMGDNLGAQPDSASSAVVRQAAAVAAKAAPASAPRPNAGFAQGHMSAAEIFALATAGT